MLGTTAVRDTLEEAVRAAYAAAERVHFDGKYSRSDIGLSALRESQFKKRVNAGTAGICRKNEHYGIREI